MNKGHIRHHLYLGAVYARCLLQDAVHPLLHRSGIHIHAVPIRAAVQVVDHIGVGFHMLMEHFKKLFFRVICGKMDTGFPLKAEKGITTIYRFGFFAFIPLSPYLFSLVLWKKA